MKIHLLPNGILPTRAHHDDAGIDCYARASVVIHPSQTAVVPLGFAIALPAYHEMQIRGRSGLAAKGLWCHVGTIDTGYRGEVSAILHNLTQSPYEVKAGQRIAQAVISRYTTPRLELTPEPLPTTERGSAGFGSTGT
jgi:dUTP pyrophosphatase